MGTEHEGRRILDSLPDGVIVADTKGTITYVNAAAEHLLRVSATHLIGAGLPDALAAAPNLQELAQAAFSSQGARVFRHGLRTHRETATRVNAVGVVVDGVGLILGLRDASLSAELSREAQRADHAAQLQAVASGMAHEIKNPLGGMRGAVQLLARELQSNPSAQEYLEVILREIDRVAAIVDTLKDLANPPKPPAPVPVDINRILNEIALLHGTGQAEFKLEFDPSLPVVSGDPAALTQAFLNLVLNALEAKATRIQVRTQVATGMSMRDDAGRRRPLITIEIEDDGVGIPEESLELIFTPFFTTRAEGSGLGLATTLRVIAAHSGRITVRTSTTKGTVFVVTLPGQHRSDYGQ